MPVDRRQQQQGRGAPGDRGEEAALRVLILDDDPAEARTLQAALEAAAGLSVELEWLDRLNSGLDRLAEGGIDVVILGLPMRDSSGLDTFRTVRDQAPDVPVLISAGRDEHGLGVTAVREGAQDHLVKDEEWPSTLARSLRHAIARQAIVVELRRLALVDELTGLHNRRGFVWLAAQLLKVANRNGLGTSLVYMDIDGLKAINDTHGHHRGDDVFVAVADRLRRTFRAADVVARVGGDEFCALLVADGSRGSVPVRRLLEEPMIILFDDGGAVTVSLSVGIAHSDPADEMAIDELMRRADASMYLDKNLKARPARPERGPGPI